MFTIVCQGLQSCHEPCLINPLIFKHIFPNPKPKTQENENKNTNTKQDKGNLSAWNFIQSLATHQANPDNFDPAAPPSPEKFSVSGPATDFVAKQFSKTLSKKSLDMCTESLGSENGTHELFILEEENRERDHCVCPSRARGLMKKMLPPPLSSSHSVQVKPHRENGRLVIKVIVKKAQKNCFRVERKNGSLKLSLLEEYIYADNEREGDVDVDCKLARGVVENSGTFGGEIEKMKSMCREEENEKSGMCNWGNFLMATS